MKKHHQCSILAFAKKGHLETDLSDEASGDSDLDDFLDDSELEASSGTVESSEAYSE